ncbi:hypothetical protein BGW38_004875 [Lunasporangiospora selenospora]|uniref:AB hydrolase-1 domain-containing protein n=1 Tax=Lunasporangiospora selenospora TaxID=979761 RepID=A0A9P6FZV0_9FUNG|nr:hypothetical protein BGW38_004875 [Lunasporangiospora selenospora]
MKAAVVVPDLRIRAQNDPTPDPKDPMYQLNGDPDFHYELLRVLGLAPYQGSDIGEVLVASNQIKTGNMSDFSMAFDELATRVDGIAKNIDSSKHPVSARNAFFKAATYYRSADFFLHGNWSDPRINSLWAKHRVVIDAALALLPVPGKRVNLPSTDGKFTVPAIFFGSGSSEPRPTIIMCNGYDGAQEELYHVFAQAALERGINIITYEGPGQPTVRREQNIGFIPDWEKAASPVIDYALTLSEVKPDSIALLGYSLGGYLATRVAAFDHRVAAVIAIDGIYDYGKTLTDPLGPEMMQLFKDGKKEIFDDIIINHIIANQSIPTSARWALQQGLWSFITHSPFEYYTLSQAYSMVGLTDKVQVPVFVGDAESDIYFPGQAKALAAHLGDKATLFEFKGSEGAGAHCAVGANVYLNQVILDWFDEVLKKAGK